MTFLRGHVFMLNMRTRPPAQHEDMSSHVLLLSMGTCPLAEQDGMSSCSTRRRVLLLDRKTRNETISRLVSPPQPPIYIYICIWGWPFKGRSALVRAHVYSAGALMSISGLTRGARCRAGWRPTGTRARCWHRCWSRGEGCS